MNLAYKILTDGKSFNNTVWHKPSGKRPGKWMDPIEGEIIPCLNAYHVLESPEQVLEWLYTGNEIWIVEYRGEAVQHDDGSPKLAVRQARLIRKTPWNDREARLFAADCAERVLPVFEEKYTDDNRPRKAIEAARAFAFGEIDKTELHAAWAAAETAAGAAAYAAGAAAGAAAYAAGDAAYAAWAAAEAAAGAAAGAAWAAAWDAECEWQAARLAEVIGGLE